MNSRLKAALDMPKAPKSKSRSNAASGDLRVNVFSSDVSDATHFVVGMQRMDPVRPFTVLIFALFGDVDAGPDAYCFICCLRRCHPARSRFGRGRPS